RGSGREMGRSPAGAAAAGAPARPGQERATVAALARDGRCIVPATRHGDEPQPAACLRQSTRSAAYSRRNCLHPAQACVGRRGAGASDHGAQARNTTCIRHSCAVALLQSGTDVTVIRDYLGHASVETTGRYITTNLQMKRDALKTFWKHAGLEPDRAKPWKPKPNLLPFMQSL